VKGDAIVRTTTALLAALLLSSTSSFAQVTTLSAIAPPRTNPGLGPYTVTPAIVACTDLPAAAPSAAFRILSAQAPDAHQIYAPGELVVLNGGTPQGLAVGQQYFARRQAYGLAVRTAGWLTVVAADARFALARIDYACDTVVAGDYLDAFAEPVLPLSVASGGEANFSDLGHVLFGSDRRQMFGAGDLANIDRGKTQGIAPGTRVGFYRNRSNGTPLVEMGAGVVVEVAERTSKVVLLNSRDAVQTGDYVVVRGTP